MRTAVRPVLVLLALALVVSPPRAQGKLYFVQNGNGTDPLRRADLDGSSLEVIVPGLGGPQDVAVDPVAGKVYWTDGASVQRSNLDGSTVETLVTTTGLLRGLAVDPAGGKVYWGDLINDVLQRANLDGTGVEDLVTTGVQVPERIALDTAAGKMYWTDLNAQHIRRSNLDGSSVELVHGFQGLGIAVDPSAGLLYFTAGSSVLRSSLTGGPTTTLVTVSGLLRGLDLDVAGGKMYWTDASGGRVQRANLDGSGVEDLITAGLDTPLGLELDVGAPSPAVVAYGCGVNPSGSLSVSSGTPAIGTTLTFAVDNPLGTQTAGSLSFLLLAAAPDPAFPCGTPLTGFGMSGPGAVGELLVDVTTPPLILSGPLYAPGAPSSFPVAVPAGAGFVGASAFAQGALFDASAVGTGGVVIGLTVGLQLVIG